MQNRPPWIPPPPPPDDRSVEDVLDGVDYVVDETLPPGSVLAPLPPHLTFPDPAVELRMSDAVQRPRHAATYRAGPPSGDGHHGRGGEGDPREHPGQELQEVVAPRHRRGHHRAGGYSGTGHAGSHRARRRAPSGGCGSSVLRAPPRARQDRAGSGGGSPPAWIAAPWSLRCPRRGESMSSSACRVPSGCRLRCGQPAADLPRSPTRP